MPAKGSSKYGADVIVGSPEYFKRIRAARPEASRLAREKYRAKQREAYLATRLAETDGIPIDQALEEIRARHESYTAMRKDMITNPVAVVHDGEDRREIPMVREHADKYNVSYEVADRIMDDPNPSNWPALFEAEVAKNAK